MNTTTDRPAVSAELESRILKEGYGPGAWHGADLKAALADVPPALAFRRPAAGRHNIAEIALHHAYCTRAVAAQLSGSDEPFVMEGEDWFELSGEKTMTWAKVQATVQSYQEQLAAAVADIEGGRKTSPLPEAERFNLVLGITCHAVYHAGQIQLIKKLLAA
jgi:DinB family protein